MKYSHNEGFYELIREAREHKKVYDDYATGRSQYVTNIYESETHKYTVVQDIDNGIFYSVEKESVKCEN